MRTILLLAGSLLALAPDAPFEGTLTVRVGGPGGTGAMVMKLTAKGTKVLTVMALPGNNQELRSVTDNKAHTTTNFTPFPPGMAKPAGVADAKGVVTVVKNPVFGPPVMKRGEKTDIRALGTSQSIAGYRCDDFEFTGEAGAVTRMCLSKQLGAIFPGVMGGKNLNGQATPWAAALGDKPMTPLKVWRPGGETILEVIEVKRQLVSPHVFDAPPGYIDIATAMKNRTTLPPSRP
ncbi:MAG: DUF4412 domain-containing protein [Gemmatimonadales bacterium]